MIFTTWPRSSRHPLISNTSIASSYPLGGLAITTPYGYPLCGVLDVLYARDGTLSPSRPRIRVCILCGMVVLQLLCP